MAIGREVAKAKGINRSCPVVDRYTVSRLRVGDLCWTCACRIVEIGGDEGMTFAWCDCEFPEDHHEMEVL